MRMRLADYVYQIFSRLHRSNDGWTRTLMAWTGFCFLMTPHALFWKMHFCLSAMMTFTRIRDKGVEPTVDEVYILDTLFAND